MDFTKKKPVRPPLTPQQENKQMEQYIRDLNLDGMVMLPGKSEPEEMVGIDQMLLKEKQQEHQERMSLLLRHMAATWQCTRCGRETSGKYIRVRVIGGLWQDVNGVRTLVGGEEILVCSNQRCDGPVVMIKDPYRSKFI